MLLIEKYQEGALVPSQLVEQGSHRSGKSGGKRGGTGSQGNSQSGRGKFEKLVFVRTAVFSYCKKILVFYACLLVNSYSRVFNFFGSAHKIRKTVSENLKFLHRKSGISQ